MLCGAGPANVANAMLRRMEATQGSRQRNGQFRAHWERDTVWQGSELGALEGRGGEGGGPELHACYRAVCNKNM